MLNLHGVLMQIHDKGVLLMGPPGVGKSENALALIARGHRLIADDCPVFSRTALGFIGKAQEEQKGLLCVRPLGLIDVFSLFSQDALADEITLDLMITLDNSVDKVAPQKLDLELDNKLVGGLAIPALTLPIASSHNVAILIETAVKLAFMPKSQRVERFLTT
ncbi:MAG: hypothetical protein AB7I18_02280 [Candidatus Berkiella sp.]